MTEQDLTPAFDYGQLDGETWKFVKDATDTIHQVRGQAIVLIGEKLAGVKARLEHGLYGEWLDKEFAWSERTARNYVQVFETFGKSAKFADISRHIDRSATYLLAAPSTPQEARDEAIEKAEAGERVTHKTSKEIVAKHKQPLSKPQKMQRDAEGQARRDRRRRLPRGGRPVGLQAPGADQRYRNRRRGGQATGREGEGLLGDPTRDHRVGR
jgi:Protein of unknown function (DUF3102)